MRVTPRLGRSGPAAGCLTVLLAAGALHPLAQDRASSPNPAGRIVAVGDVHGDYRQFVQVLRDTGLIDRRNRWIGGTDRLVQTGDILDRGPDSRKVMDLLMELAPRARDAGGEIHVLLGNHEAMNAYGDLSYVSSAEYDAFRTDRSEAARDALYERYAARQQTPLSREEFDRQIPLGWIEHRQAFSPDGPYGQWIRERPAVLRIDRTLFLHGGIGPAYADWTVARINESVRAELGRLPAAAGPEDLAGTVVTDPEGPLWYRGLIQGLEADLVAPERTLSDHVDSVLRLHDADRIVVGHTVTAVVLPRFGGKVIGIDTGMSAVYGGPAAALVIDGEALSTVHRGVTVPFPDPPDRSLDDYLDALIALEPDPAFVRGRLAALGALGEPVR